MNMQSMQRVYQDAQEHCDLKPGDWVKVLRKAESGEAGWDGEWSDLRDTLVGKIVKVDFICSSGISVVVDEKLAVELPYFILKKVHNPTCPFKTFDKVLVLLKEAQVWYPALFGKYAPEDEYPYNSIFPVAFKNKYKMTCIESVFSKCIAYQGNEHLAYTTEEPEKI